MLTCSMCRISGMNGDTPATLPAGDVSGQLGICGYETAAQSLPKLNAADQIYTSGYCPGTALERGTMFPELYNKYGS
ncbi:MAG: spore coat associated protein CotJA [Clostridia bacterium]|nr:spore coat associated protein CotJA [Clostridia bacterium]MBR3487586.1 spore coat associated protein CotJA [Clostridia bacterium]